MKKILFLVSFILLNCASYAQVTFQHSFDKNEVINTLPLDGSSDASIVKFLPGDAVYDDDDVNDSRYDPRTVVVPIAEYEEITG